MKKLFITSIAILFLLTSCVVVDDTPVVRTTYVAPVSTTVVVPDNYVLIDGVWYDPYVYYYEPPVYYDPWTDTIYY